ncbi:hypothetical protein AAZX31_04G103800 [Glycine max]|nr:hypothetical protein JHK85_009933 [Glycine max]
MDTLSKYLEHITSTLYTCILLWKAKQPFPLENTPKRHRTGKSQAGLKTLVHSEEKARPRVVHRCTMEEETTESEPSPPPLSWLRSPSSPAFQTTMLGDVIGTESGDCMITDVEELRTESEPRKTIIKRRERGRKREFPPPITLLRETGEMPWSLEREYSGDGRLIITAVPETVVKRGHEYCSIMEARREDGRLTMRFVPEEDGDYCEECGYAIDDEEDLEFNQGFDSVDDEDECGFEFEEESAKEATNESERCGKLDLRECVTYDGPGLGPVEMLQLPHSDSDPFLKGTGFGDLNTCLGRPASAPLRPMTPVM